MWRAIELGLNDGEEPLFFVGYDLSPHTDKETKMIKNGRIYEFGDRVKSNKASKRP